MRATTLALLLLCPATAVVAQTPDHLVGLTRLIRAIHELRAVVPWLDQPAGEQPAVTDPAGPRRAEGAS